MKVIFKNKLFLVMFVSDMLSNFGDTMYYLALMSYVALLPEAKLGISIVTLSESIPYLTMMIMGAWADKTVNKQSRIVLTLIFRVALYCLIGLLMGFTPALWIVVIAAVINVFSDLSGQYSSYLFVPLSLRIVRKEDREVTIAFRQGTSSALKIAFQSSGAILIGIMSYQHLAFFNAATFGVSALIMLAMRPAFDKLLTAEPIQISEKSSEPQNIFKHMTTSIKLAWEEIKKLPILKTAILLVTAMNAIFGVLDSIIVLTIKEAPHFMIVNTATTLATVAITALVGQILGSYLTMGTLKNVPLMPIFLFIGTLPVCIFTSLFFQNIYLLLTFYFLVAFNVGILSPKLQALVWNSIPEERIATAGAGIDSIATFGMVLSRFLVSGLVVVLRAHQIAILFILLSLGLLGYTVRVIKRSKD